LLAILRCRVEIRRKRSRRSFRERASPLEMAPLRPGRRRARPGEEAEPAEEVDPAALWDTSYPLPFDRWETWLPRKATGGAEVVNRRREAVLRRWEAVLEVEALLAQVGRLRE
jgi:hypothetical protein